MAASRRILATGVALLPVPAWASDNHHAAFGAAIVGVVIFIAMLIYPMKRSGR